MLRRGFLANTRLGTTYCYSNKLINKYLENTHDVFKKIYTYLSNNQNLPLEGPVRHNTFKRLI